jgi:hypothetical protein
MHYSDPTQVNVYQVGYHLKDVFPVNEHAT